MAIKPPTPVQKEIYQLAYEQIQCNTALPRPGMSFKELSSNALTYDPDKFQRYSCLYHGIGLCVLKAT